MKHFIVQKLVKAKDIADALKDEESLYVEGFKIESTTKKPKK